MSRPRYPSDEARLKVRPHIKVHLTVATHRKTAEAWADPRMRGMLVELWRLAHEAHASKTHDEVILSPGSVVDVTGNPHHFYARRLLRSLCKSVGYGYRESGVSTIVSIRNFAKKQGLDSAVRGADAEHYAETSATPPPSASASASALESSLPPRSHTEASTPSVTLSGTRSARSRPAPAAPLFEPKAKTNGTLPAWSYEAADALIRHVSETPGARIARGARSPWAREIAKLASEVKGVEPEKIGEHVTNTIDWLFGPENCGEFEIVVRSARTLREKWSQIQAKRSRSQRNAKPLPKMTPTFQKALDEAAMRRKGLLPKRPTT